MGIRISNMITIMGMVLQVSSTQIVSIMMIEVIIIHSKMELCLELRVLFKHKRLEGLYFNLKTREMVMYLEVLIKVKELAS